MDGQFLIYDGFQNDASPIFSGIIEMYSFEIQAKSDSGIHFINGRCKLDIHYETGIQVWITILKYNISEMIPRLCMFKGKDVFEEYRQCR